MKLVLKKLNRLRFIKRQIPNMDTIFAQEEKEWWDFIILKNLKEKSLKK